MSLELFIPVPQEAGEPYQKQVLARIGIMPDGNVGISRNDAQYAQAVDKMQGTNFLSQTFQDLSAEGQMNNKQPNVERATIDLWTRSPISVTENGTVFPLPFVYIADGEEKHIDTYTYFVALEAQSQPLDAKDQLPEEGTIFLAKEEKTKNLFTTLKQKLKMLFPSRREQTNT